MKIINRMKIIAVLFCFVTTLLYGAIVPIPPVPIKKIEDSTRLFAFTLEAPKKSTKLEITPDVFPIHANKRYWVEMYDLPSFEVVAKKNGKLKFSLPPVNYTQVMISATEGNLLRDINNKKWKQFSGAHRFPSRNNWTGLESIQKMLGEMRRNVQPRFIEVKNNSLLLDNSNDKAVTVISPSFSFSGGKEYMLRAEFAMKAYPIDADASWWLEVSTNNGKFYYNVGNFYPRHTPKGDWLISYLRFNIPAAEKDVKGRLIFHVEGAKAPIQWRNWDLRVCPAMRFKMPRKEIPKAQISDSELIKRLTNRVPATAKVLNGQVYINGKIVPKMAYLGFGDSGHKYFSESGVNWQYIYIYSAMTGKNNWRGEKIWIGPGKYDFAALDRRIAHLMKFAPNTTWMLYLFCDPYPDFGKNHPESITIFSDGSKKLMDGSGSWRTESWQAWHYSAASSAYRKEVNDFLRALGKHLEQSPYGRAIAGVHLGGGHDGQYFPPPFDGSPANRKAFQEWLRKRYHNNVKELSLAWNMKISDFNHAPYPSAQNMEKSKGFFLTASADQQIIDASIFRSESMVETISGMAEALKAGLSRPILVTSYYNDTIAGYDLGKDSLKVFLESPALDGLVSVVEYAPNRFPGRGGNVTSLGGSLRLHRKLWLAELDYRTEYTETWYERGISYDQVVSGASRNVEENDAQLRRDFGRMLTQGHGAWFYSLSGPGWSFPEYQKSIQEGLRAAMMSAKEPQSAHYGQMAVFYGEEDLHSYSRRGNFRLFAHQLNAFYLRDILNRSGLSYDAYLLSDLENEKRPDYRINIFVNCASLTKKQIKFIRKNLQKDNHILIFMFDSGRLSPGGFSSTLKKIAGIRAEIDENKVVDYSLTPSSLKLPLSEAFGHLFTKMTGPQIKIKGRRFTPLATYPDGSPAAVFRDFGNWKSIYIGAPGALSTELLQAAAKLVGVTPLAEAGDAVYAGNGFLVIHATSDGPKKLQWTKNCKVIDLTTGKVVKEAAKEMKIMMSGGETRWFRLLPL